MSPGKSSKHSAKSPHHRSTKHPDTRTSENPPDHQGSAHKVTPLTNPIPASTSEQHPGAALPKNPGAAAQERQKKMPDPRKGRGLAAPQSMAGSVAYGATEKSAGHTRGTRGARGNQARRGGSRGLAAPQRAVGVSPAAPPRRGATGTHGAHAGRGTTGRGGAWRPLRDTARGAACGATGRRVPGPPPGVRTQNRGAQRPGSGLAARGGRRPRWRAGSSLDKWGRSDSSGRCPGCSCGWVALR